MFEHLNNYLEEISRFLINHDSKDEIIYNIRKNIIDQTNTKFNEVTEEGLKSIIKKNGSPSEAVDKYIMKLNTDSIPFKNYLFLYTIKLFAIHLGIYIISLITGNDIYLFPFLFAQDKGIIFFLLSLPIIFLSDFIIVSLILSFLIYFKINYKLPWLTGFNSRKETKSKKSSLILSILLFIIFSIIYINYGTIFVSFSTKDGRLLPLPIIIWNSQIPSVLILSGIAVSIISLSIKQFYNSIWFELAVPFIQLVLLFFIAKTPFMENNFTNYAYSGFKAFFILITVLVTLQLVKKTINFFVWRIGKL